MWQSRRGAVDLMNKIYKSRDEEIIQLKDRNKDLKRFQRWDCIWSGSWTMGWAFSYGYGQGQEGHSGMGRGSNPTKGTETQRCSEYLGPMSGLVWLACGVPSKRKPSKNEPRNRQVSGREEPWILFKYRLGPISQCFPNPAMIPEPIHCGSDSI